MQSMIRASSAILRRRSCSSIGSCEFTRSLSSQSSNELLDDPLSSVIVEGKASSRTAILNRPSHLNALNTSMATRLQKLYKSWEGNREVGFVVMKGSDRAFSAGGDIVALYHMINKGDLDGCKEFFWEIYNFIYLVGTYLKPNVAILNGITMGGGAGVSIPCLFRVATDKTVISSLLDDLFRSEPHLNAVLQSLAKQGTEGLLWNVNVDNSATSKREIFATPETLIGFHPDAGASFHLSHLPGHLGEYLGLTGDRLSGVEMMACGLATHYSLSANLPAMEHLLGELVTDDPSVIETSLEKYGDLVYPDNSSVLRRIETLDKCFSHETVEEIIDALESEAAKTHDVWCFSTLKKLKDASPLSLKVSLRSIREGRLQTLDQCLIREYRMTLQAISRKISNDFCEGVRARVVDKDFAPKWDPPSLKHVSQDMVDQYFSSLTALEPELELPIEQREAFT